MIKSPKGIIGKITDDGELYTVSKTRSVLLNGPSKNKYNCSKSARGEWCAAVIMLDNWEIKDDYPW